ncbi:MAG: glutathione S-transferase family protein [Micropepsaceae bacterium]
MLKVFHAPGSRSLRVLWTLHEIGLDAEIVTLGYPPRLKEPEYVKLNPSGLAPALADGDLFLTESMAICDHLARLRPEAGLTPGPGDDSDGYQTWTWFGEATLMFSVAALFRATRFGITADHPFFEDLTAGLENRLASLEARLQGRDFAACDRLTLADISCGFPLYRLDVLKLAGRFGPATAAYYKALSGRPAFQAALAR